ncbi:MAG: hypothetical protein E6J79_18190 [Deltaproteobacteria bacterium]|nr:MAG: hypothetical protein E6J79_18190 [Deltaproteobacteria bacterium]
MGGRTREERLETADRAAAGARDPIPLGLGRGDAHQQARLGPRKLAVLERRGDLGQLAEPSRDAGQLLDLASREAETLACVVAEPGPSL